MNLSNIPTKVAFITGAARRIGAEIATLLHDNDFNVILHHNFSEKEADALSVVLNKKRANSAITLKADLCQTELLAGMIQDAATIWGRLDALVNNASSFYATPVGTTKELDWDNLLNSNLKAPYFLSEACAPFLRENAGCIINITDIHGERPMKDYPIYSIAKAGLLMLTKALARELGPEIRVNSVSPGAILWPEGENMLSPETKENIVKKTLLQRQGSPEEIAKAVLFLVKEADYVTGQDLAVDGGRSLFI